MIKKIEKNNKLNFHGEQSRTIYVSGTSDGFYNLSFQKNLNYTPKAIVMTIESKFTYSEMCVVKNAINMECFKTLV